MGVGGQCPGAGVVQGDGHFANLGGDGCAAAVLNVTGDAARKAGTAREGQAEFGVAAHQDASFQLLAGGEQLGIIFSAVPAIVADGQQDTFAVLAGA